MFEELEKVTPARVLGVTDADDAWDAFNRLGDAGVDLAELPAAMRRMAKDPLFLGRKVPWPLERWLAKGQYRGWLADPQLPFDAPKAPPAAEQQAHAAPQADQAIWARVSDRLRDALTENTFGSWFGRAYLGQIRGQLFLVAATSSARDWIRSNRWRSVAAWWAEADAAKRPLTLVSKIEFEASVARQTEGVG